ncbi:MAG: 8-amino-7-oxononanoate synthase [Candidatus Omnitrophica bacterium CG1_02_49_10]|nr:MAG: 8-amino-7-oxononanoate synthase [Candidatus Omnitrophica bacterium CG1_02_49_10]
MEKLLKEELNILKEKGLYRALRRVSSGAGPTAVVDGREVINLCSNNYLGLAKHPALIEASIEATKKYGTGSGASRLVSGNIELYEELESLLAEFKGTESALVFSSGYSANIGAITALMSSGDFVVSDRLNHASIIDGCRLSGAKFNVYPHKDTKKLEEILSRATGRYGKIVIATDSVFSMDGDIAPLDILSEIADRYGAYLFIDDAHATGVLGPEGRGSLSHFGIDGGEFIEMGTLSKALGSLGGFIAGSSHLVNYLKNKARSFIYSTALPPSVLASSIAALKIVKSDGSFREKLWENVSRFREPLQALGFDTMDSATQIIPVLIGDNKKTMEFSEMLFERGVFAQGIRPPTVPDGTARIRASISSAHTDEHIERAVKAFKDAGKEAGVI